MKRGNRKKLPAAAGMLAAFGVWTLAVQAIDVKNIGPLGSAIGFAAMNGFVQDLTGVHMSLYAVTDGLSLIPIGFVLGFALLGLRQWITRRSLLKVDADILALGGFYVAVLASYVFFEVFPVNCRPVLIDGMLEASYPSSTTVLVLCVMGTAAMQFRMRMKSGVFRRYVLLAMTAFAVMMVAGRLISGVHWLSDIIGGVLLSAGLVLLYDWVCSAMKRS